MRATLMYGAGDVRVEDVPHSVVKLPGDAATWSCPRLRSPTVPASSAARGCRPPAPTRRPASGTSSRSRARQADAIRVPLADGTLVKLPVAPDAALIPSLLTLSDVLGTGHHAAVVGGVGPRTHVTVIGDGAVGLLSVLSARRSAPSRSSSWAATRPH